MPVTLNFVPARIADQGWDREHLTSLLAALDDIGCTPDQSREYATELLMQLDEES